jgi:hypothetical protein
LTIVSLISRLESSARSARASIQPTESRNLICCVSVTPSC